MNSMCPWQHASKTLPTGTSESPPPPPPRRRPAQHRPRPVPPRSLARAVSAPVPRPQSSSCSPGLFPLILRTALNGHKIRAPGILRSPTPTPAHFRHSLGSVNSVNIIRLLIQAANFIYAYLSVRPGASGDVEFAVCALCLAPAQRSAAAPPRGPRRLFTPHRRRAFAYASEFSSTIPSRLRRFPAHPTPEPLPPQVPSGAAGQLASGLLAVALGLPARLIGGTNRNDALHRVLSGGLLRPSRAKKTVSPSMDIQVAGLPPLARLP
jgi:hypothetical protein